MGRASMNLKIVYGLFFTMALVYGASATGQTPTVSEKVNGGAIWVDAIPARSCRIVCEAMGNGWKGVAGPKTSQTVHPLYVCARKSNGTPGSNHTYSDKASKLCHYQASGKGYGDESYSCLCAVNR